MKQNIIVYPSIVNYLSCITQIYARCCSPHKLRSGLVDNWLMSRHHIVHMHVRHVSKCSLNTHIGIAEIAKPLLRRIHLLDLPLVVDTFRSFPHSWHITGFVTRLTRRVPLVELELLTLSVHLSSPPVLSGVSVTRSSVLFVCFVVRCLSFCPFSFGHCVVSFSSIYDSDYHFIFRLFLTHKFIHTVIYKKDKYTNDNTIFNGGLKKVTKCMYL